MVDSRTLVRISSEFGVHLASYNPPSGIMLGISEI